MKRLALLVAAAMVAMLILAPTAFAQTMQVEQTTKVEQPLPSSGGVTPAVLLPAAALLMGSGVLAYTILRRR